MQQSYKDIYWVYLIKSSNLWNLELLENFQNICDKSIIHIMHNNIHDTILSLSSRVDGITYNGKSNRKSDQIYFLEVVIPNDAEIIEIGKNEFVCEKIKIKHIWIIRGYLDFPDINYDKRIKNMHKLV